MDPMDPLHYNLPHINRPPHCSSKLSSLSNNSSNNSLEWRSSGNLLTDLLTNPSPIRMALNTLRSSILNNILPKLTHNNQEDLSPVLMAYSTLMCHLLL
jgi:hypothetical protein